MGKAIMKATAGLRLGAASPGGLALPGAAPTPSQMYAPRGVFLNEEWLVVADSGNHRILLWHGLPAQDGQPADVVLCQQDFFAEGPGANGRGPANGLHLPTAVSIHQGRLMVADPWHHRILVWETVPTANDTPARLCHRTAGPGIGRAEPGRRYQSRYPLLALRLRLRRKMVLYRGHRQSPRPWLAWLSASRPGAACHSRSAGRSQQRRESRRPSFSKVLPLASRHCWK